MTTPPQLPGSMPATILRSLLVLVLALGAGGCGAGGGPIGTGIFASVSGNVIETGTVLSSSTDSEAEIGAALSTEGVLVSIAELPGAATETDAEGNFALEGDFSGELTLVFETGTLMATAEVEIPVGAALVLSDIALSDGSVRPGATQALNVIGTIREVDCDSGEIVLRERAQDRRLQVLLDENTVIIDSVTEEAQGCSSLERNATILVGGIPEPEKRALVADLVRTRATPNDRPPVREPVRFHGVIRQQRCEADLLVVENRDQALRIRIMEDTVLENRFGRPLACADFARNRTVRGKGMIDLRQPGSTFASQITLLGEPEAAGTPRPLAGRSGN